MSINSLSKPTAERVDASQGASPLSLITTLLRPFASLRLTVALFAMGIFIILVGTLAQVEKDMWDVIDDYFRAQISWIEFRVLFPPSFFPGMPQLSGGFPFPGGWTIGFLLMMNLLAAHLVRFKLQAKGTRLWMGLVALALGAAFTWLVIAGGSMGRGFQGLPILPWATMWQLVKLLLVGLWVGSIVQLVRMDRSQRVAWYSMATTCGGLGVVVLFCLLWGDAIRPADPSMRILWQLIQATSAGLVLLVGCVMLFKKRGGIVLIHLGVGLMMLGELLVGMYAVEEQMQIPEGRTTNFARDIRAVELAVVDSSGPDEEKVVVVPGSLLAAGKKIGHDDLPFEIHVIEYFRNANLVSPDKTKEENPATAGNGLRFVAEAARRASGADSSGAVDMAAAYVRLVPKNESENAKTYLLAQQFGDGELTVGANRPEKVPVGDKTYDVSLRFKRNYKPYAIRLLDIRKEDYLGTSTPRDYSSYIHLVDSSNNIDRDDVRIWMNNPLRYGGETFYQSNYSVDLSGRETTTLQIVTNSGWMIPYVACMLVIVGLAQNFGATLFRFLNRLQRSDPATNPSTDERNAKKPRRKKSAEELAPQPGLATLIIPVAMVGLVALFALSRATPRTADNGSMDLAAFGETPIVFEGRVKPIDTLARNALQRVSNKQVLITVDDEGEEEKQPAVHWLLDVMSQSPGADEHRVFRIENLDVLERLGLERRKGFRYALSEFRDKVFDGYAYNDEFSAEVRKLREVAKADATQLTTYERKFLELDSRFSQYRRLADSFRPLPFPVAPSQEDMEKDPEQTRKRISEIQQMLAAVPKMEQWLNDMEPPLIVPAVAETDNPDKPWRSYAAAVNRAYVQRVFLDSDVDPGVMAWTRILDAYARHHAGDFNRFVNEYQQQLSTSEPVDLDNRKVSYEAFINRFSPFSNAAAFYVFAFVITAASWLFSSQATNRAAYWLILATFVLHTFALASRIYISGRPPVTNLYSSAVFIGWGGVILGLGLEAVYRIGIGNLVASVCGFCTLVIAHFLAARGDTFTVLQAVLDTQFWLATHVVCVSLGYATTFVSGVLGFVYVVGAFATKSVDKKTGAMLSRMIYGSVCFALFFSFFGTVLGGLWADDSWGRFWGWDPKENGALIIVLWNALILHARWGGMVGARGLAVLAVLGNITTSWSWFGVNELGIGLHSYGFTEGVLLYLGIFALINVIVVIIGLMPLRLWRSHTG